MAHIRGRREDWSSGFEGAVRFENVSFGYEEDGGGRQILRDVSFTVRAGALLLAAFTTLPVAARAAIPAAERLLPQDTLVLVTVPDFTNLRELSNAQPTSGLWSDPALKPFRDHFVSKLQEEIVKPMERELSVDLASYAKLPQGQLTFAVTKPAAGQSEPGRPVAS